MTNTTRLPDAREDRVIECPVCSSVMTTMEAEGVTVEPVQKVFGPPKPLL